MTTIQVACGCQCGDSESTAHHAYLALPCGVPNRQLDATTPVRHRLPERGLDGGIVRLYKVALHELNTQRRLACTCERTHNNGTTVSAGHPVTKQRGNGSAWHPAYG
jgi:hypothetical protein